MRCALLASRQMRPGTFSLVLVSFPSFFLMRGAEVRKTAKLMRVVLGIEEPFTFVVSTLLCRYAEHGTEEEKPESILEGISVLQNAQKLIGPFLCFSFLASLNSSEAWLKDVASAAMSWSCALPWVL